MTESEPTFDRFFDSMEALADTISESLQAQVTIEDSNHHVIGYSSHQFESDPARISTIIGKRVPNTVIIGLRKKGVMHQLEHAAHPVRIPAVMEVGLGPRLAMCIKHREEILGYIWVVDQGNLAEGYAEEIVKKAAGIAGRYLLKQRGWKTRQDKAFEDFFWKLLTSHYESEQRIRQEAETGSILLPVSYNIAVLESGEDIGGQLAQKLRQMLETYPGQRLVLLTAGHDRLILLFTSLFGADNPEALTAFLHKLLQDISRNEGTLLTAGCSLNYREYTSAAAAYREALAVLELRKLLPYHTRHLLLYEELGFWAYMPAIVESKRSLGRRAPLLRTLREHDGEHKSDFVKTIAVYLSLNGNLKESAAFLHIHTNTLMYRLNKIAELTGHSLKETDYRTSVYLELLSEETAQLNSWFQEGG
ncbi:helix-turn-helix domain-containing protein [Paenibacillus sp. FSL R7-0273]|uniref:PucR family transcriptional regulator n=1 Tax=Paenibacillus sp. FSL R7-0273 TaxID=1536772 RepID=UPI000693621A|nr:helix-turn-helix domain-containing protein [Paenibacillus sp. FSL R7-0273]